MKKILSILILVMMLATALPGLASTNWIRSIEAPDFHNNKWVEYKDGDWKVNNSEEMGVYHWNATSGFDYGWTINKDSSTNRGFNFYLAMANGTDFGTIFNFKNSSDFNLIYIQPASAQVSLWHWNGTTFNQKSSYYEVFNGTSFDSVPVLTKCIHNRYTGHIQFKIWGFLSDEPRNWTFDITDSSNFSRSTSTKWGLYSEGTEPDGTLFAYYATQELPYNIIGNSPTITAPEVDVDDVEDIFNDDGGPPDQDEFDTWNSIDLQVLPVYPITDHPNDNVYIYSAWDCDEMKLGFVIWVCADDTNETTPDWDADWVYAIFDVDHDHDTSRGDKMVFFSANETTGLHLATYNGTDWEEDTGWADVMTIYEGYDIQMMRDYRKWFIVVDLEEIIGNEDKVWEFVEDTDEIGLQLFGYGTLAPGWAWSSWDIEDNSSIAYPDAINNETYWGDLRLSGENPNPDYVDLNDLDAGALEEDVVEYESAVKNVPRWAISAEEMRNGNITIISVPIEFEYEYFFGLLGGTGNLEELIIYSVNVTGEMTKVALEYDVDEDDNIWNVTLDEVPDDADAIAVVPNPSWFDTNKYMFNWLYGEYMLAVK